MDGNELQQAKVYAGIADTAIARFAEQLSPPTPPSAATVVLKWVAGIGASLLTMFFGGIAAWLLVSVSDMRDTLGRMDERMKAQSLILDGKVAELDRRVRTLESYHSPGTKP